MLLNLLWKERSTNAPFGEDPSIILRANGVIHNPLGPPLSKGEGRREKVRAEAIPPRVEGSTRFRGLPLRLTLPNGGTKSPSKSEDGGLGYSPVYIFPHRGIEGGPLPEHQRGRGVRGLPLKINFPHRGIKGGTNPYTNGIPGPHRHSRCHSIPVPAEPHRRGLLRYTAGPGR